VHGARVAQTSFFSAGGGKMHAKPTKQDKKEMHTTTNVIVEFAFRHRDYQVNKWDQSTMYSRISIVFFASEGGRVGHVGDVGNTK